MFTGIIQAIAPVAWIEASPSLLRYALSFPSFLLENLQIGASISVHGVCQTVVAIKGNEVSFDAIEETLKRTNLNAIQPQQPLNVERSARLGDELGGHLLSGHIVDTATIVDITFPSPEQRTLTLRCDPAWIKYLLPKGYVALNGASLTIVNADPQGQFNVHLIPETLRLTTFGEAKIGDRVNLEIDAMTQSIVATVENILKKKT